MRKITLIKIRRGVFETNSSSVHTLVMSMKEEADRFFRGETLIDVDNYEFITVNDVQINDEIISKVKEIIGHYEFKWMPKTEIATLAKYYAIHGNLRGVASVSTFAGDYEFFNQEFTTPSGETIVGFGYSGRDY